MAAVRQAPEGSISSVGPVRRRFWGSLAATRLLLAMTLVLGLLASQVGARTLALALYTTQDAGSIVPVGAVDIGGLLIGSTASTLPSATAFTWSTSGAGTSCTTLLAGANVTTQAMAPGQYCVARLTVINDHPNAVDAWFRLRLVRRTAAGNTATEALNNRLRFYMSEYSAGTSRTAAQYQSTDCTTANFKPVASPAGTAKSTAPIPDASSASLGNRAALLALGTAGKNIGAHPGVAFPTDAAVTALGGSGLGIVAGTNATPTEANMTATNSFNLIGNDEVTNTRLITNSNTLSGTRPNGTLLDAQLVGRATRYYCAAMYFPSESDITAGNTAGDNAAAGASLTYHLVVTATEKANRSAN